MFKDVECGFCDGNGRIATKPGIDPFDPGQPCPKCDGSGVVTIDLNDFADEE